jgi:hypothetical protein
MKKILVTGLLFILLANCFSQTKSNKPLSSEQVRLEFANGIILFKEGVTPFYKKGMSLNEFVLSTCKDLKPTPEGNALLSVAYKYISTSTTNADILKSYSGKEMANAILFLKPIITKNPLADGAELFGGKSSNLIQVTAEAARPQCKWYQIGCLLDWIGGWINDNWGWIKPLLEGFGIIK